jgi:hypothetical protein
MAPAAARRPRDASRGQPWRLIMTKKELLKFLEPFSYDTEICVTQFRQKFGEEIELHCKPVEVTYQGVIKTQDKIILSDNYNKINDFVIVVRTKDL